MKKAFTLVELLVVIGIIAMLAGVLLGTFAGGTESARAARCLTNMKNLATACQTVGMSTGHYPTAGSFEKVGIDESRGIANAQELYWEHEGWLSWNSNGAYRSRPNSHVASSGWFTSAYVKDDKVREYCYTNGAIWKAVSANRQAYICPCHVKLMRKQNPAWSYVMNAFFWWDDSHGSEAKGQTSHGVEYGLLDRADHRLLFAELPFLDKYVTVNDSSSPGDENDCVLQYKDCEGCRTPESIGFNHVSGKDLYAHVCYADGHVERLLWPRSGLDEGKLRDLTKWLCEAVDVSFDGKRYEKMTEED